jgi:hypothetical protein
LESANALAASHAVSQAAWSRSTPARSTAISPRSTDDVQASDCSRKSAGSNSASAIPSPNALGPLIILFWLSALLTITSSARSGPTRFGSR